MWEWLAFFLLKIGVRKLLSILSNKYFPENKNKVPYLEVAEIQKTEEEIDPILKKLLEENAKFQIKIIKLSNRVDDLESNMRSLVIIEDPEGSTQIGDKKYKIGIDPYRPERWEGGHGGFPQIKE